MRPKLRINDIFYATVVELSEALDTYLKLKGIDKGKTFIRGAKRNIQYVIDFIGDLFIDAPEGLACLIMTVPVFLNDDKISKPVNISL